MLLLVLSRLKLSRDNFYDEFFQHRLVRNDGVDACLPKFVLASRTSECSTLHFVQIFDEFDNSPSSAFLTSVIASASSASLLVKKKCSISFFTFFFSCHQSSFCNIILISCSIHKVDSVSLPCVSVYLCDIPSVMIHHIIHQFRRYNNLR